LTNCLTLKNSNTIVPKINLKELSNEEIIFLWKEIEKEFEERDISFNVGALGESLAIDFFNKTPGLDNLVKAATGTKNVDALSRKGDRYSIKTIKKGTKSGTVYPDADDKDKIIFEYILVIILNSEYELKSIRRFSWNQFLQVRQWDITMNAWYIPKTIKALQQGEKIYEKE
jgi:hypothetical protein